MANPQLPYGYDLVWSSVVLLALTLVVVALVQIARSRRLSDSARGIWVLVVLLAPIAGPLAWFFIGRSASDRVGDRRPDPESKKRSATAK